MENKPCTAPAWRDLKARAYEILPTKLGKKVKIARVSGYSIGEDYEHVTYVNGIYTIKVNRNASYHVAEELLIHAIAHIKADIHGNDFPIQRGEHTAVWGVYYAETYREFRVLK